MRYDKFVHVYKCRHIRMLVHVLEVSASVSVYDGGCHFQF